MAARGVRGSAESRREDVLLAAMDAFAVGGLVGTSTEAIAQRAGISQPYLFRLYPTKKALFLTAVERTFGQVSQVFRDAAEGRTGEEAKHAMGEAYQRLLAENRTFLRMQMQAYAASVDDADVRHLTRREFGRLWETVITVSGMAEETAQAFFAHGMLLNVMAAIGITEDCPGDDPLGRRMTAQPSVFQQVDDPAPPRVTAPPAAPPRAPLPAAAPIR